MILEDRKGLTGILARLDSLDKCDEFTGIYIGCAINVNMEGAWLPVHRPPKEIRKPPTVVLLVPRSMTFSDDPSA